LTDASARSGVVETPRTDIDLLTEDVPALLSPEITR